MPYTLWLPATRRDHQAQALSTRELSSSHTLLPCTPAEGESSLRNTPNLHCTIGSQPPRVKKRRLENIKKRHAGRSTGAPQQAHHCIDNPGCADRKMSSPEGIFALQGAGTADGNLTWDHMWLANDI